MKNAVVLFFLSLIVAIAVSVLLIVKNIQFNQNCGGHLKRAADANTVDLAKEELRSALNYIENNGLTSGYTSILWRTPDEDIGFWYNNIKTAYQELDSVPNDVLTRTNSLMKLRETLLDHGTSEDSITCPDGISKYPNNLTWGLLLWIPWIAVFVFVFVASED